MQPKVSVVIPVFNRRDLITRCLDSVKSSTWKNIELIVVDNGSTDGTGDAVIRWASACGLQLSLISERKRGASAARNAGLRACSGSHTLFFDSDDVMHPALINRIMSEYDGSERYKIVCWRNRLHLLDGKTRTTHVSSKDPLGCHAIHGMLRTHGYIAPTEMWRRAGGWDENLPVWNDWELGFRMLRMAESVVCVDEVLADIYSREDSITGCGFSPKSGKWEHTIREVARKAADVGELTDRLRYMLAYREMILAAMYFREGNRENARRLRKHLSHYDFAPIRGWALGFAYLYTRYGGRGGWRLVSPFSPSH